MSAHPEGALVSNDHLSVAADTAPPGAARADPADLVALTVEAARRGDTETLEHALAAGVPVDARSPRGDTLLMLAAYHGRQEAVRLLLERGANPDLVDDRGQSPLAGAAFKGDAAMVDLLVAGGAAVDAAGAVSATWGGRSGRAR